MIHLEFTARALREDGLMEEKSCKMIDFLKFMGFDATEPNKKEPETGESNGQGTF